MQSFNSILSKCKNIFPGLLAAVIIAILAKFLEDAMPIHLIGASVIAIFIGMILNAIYKPAALSVGLKFTSKKILKLAIILLGASLSIQTVLEVGKLSLIVMCATLLTCFGGGYFIGKALGLNWKISNLISAGTGICGGSAIAAIAPVIDAEDTDIAYAMSATFLFDMAMIVLFPFMGHALGLSDMAYGLWAGTAVNDTSSVVAAGYAYSEAAGDFATMVKLTRTLSIIPTVLVFAYVNARVKQKEAGIQTTKKVNIKNLFPYFIVGFLLLSAFKSLGFIPEPVSVTLKELSKFLMVMALGAIGYSTSFKEMKKSGIAPMIHGFIISALVVIVAIGVEYLMGMV
ncbi:YeiH family protein [Candidatus Epulonipiscium viviparus]|uniref:YeiH family protein n=1 Tax=Candidatus Epulonipiscium viviparus TaxID=420336 RepID=UPI0027380720|nr:YeiH family protein [Candidatus Epulopiscium viviparus]